MITTEERTALLEERVAEVEAAYMAQGKRIEELANENSELYSANRELAAENAEVRRHADRFVSELSQAEDKVKALELTVLQLKAKLYDIMTQAEASA